MKVALRSIARGVLVVAVLVTGACASAPPPDRVYVRVAPPPERVEVMEAAPGPGYAWQKGFWRWDGRDYAWVPGRWVVVEQRHREWVAGFWEHDRHGWYWVDGHWRA